MYKLCESDQLQYPQLLFIGGLFPSELGSSPNKVVFLKATVFHSYLNLSFHSASRLLGAVLSGCHALSRQKGFEHLDRLLSGNAHSVGLFLSPPKR